MTRVRPASFFLQHDISLNPPFHVNDSLFRVRV